MIHLITGPMYAGKSTILVNTYKNLGGKFYCFTTVDKTEYKTHDGIIIDCKFVKSFTEINLNDELIFVDEVQFADYVPEPLHTMYVAGLDYDFLKNPFPIVENIRKRAYSVHQLFAKCKFCNRLAQYSKKISPSDKIIDENGEYIPVCLSCY